MRFEWLLKVNHPLKNRIQRCPSGRRMSGESQITVIKLFAKSFEALRSSGLALEVTADLKHDSLQVDRKSFGPLLRSIVQDVHWTAYRDQMCCSPSKAMEDVVLSMVLWSTEVDWCIIGTKGCQLFHVELIFLHSRENKVRNVL